MWIFRAARMRIDLDRKFTFLQNPHPNVCTSKRFFNTSLNLQQPLQTMLVCGMCPCLEV